MSSSASLISNGTGYQRSDRSKRRIMSRTVERATPIIRAISRIATAPSRCSLITSHTSRIFGLLVGIRSPRAAIQPKRWLQRPGSRPPQKWPGISRNGGRHHLEIRTAAPKPQKEKATTWPTPHCGTPYPPGSLLDENPGSTLNFIANLLSSIQIF